MALVTLATSAGITSFSPTFVSITGSMVTVPAGAQAVSITVASGGAFVDGVGPFPVGTNLRFGGNGYTLSRSFNVGATGSAAAPCKTLLVYEA